MTPEKQFLIDTEKRAREAGCRVRWWYKDYLVIGLPEDQASLKPPPDSVQGQETESAQPPIVASSEK